MFPSCPFKATRDSDHPVFHPSLDGIVPLSCRPASKPKPITEKMLDAAGLKVDGALVEFDTFETHPVLYISCVDD